MLRSWRAYLKRLPLPSTVLDVLQQKPELTLTAADKRVFLSPKEARITPRKRHNPTATAPIPPLAIIKDLWLPLLTTTGSVDSFRPDTDALSPTKFHKVVNALVDLFTTDQLKRYAQQHCTIKSRDRKRDIAAKIVSDAWKVEKTEGPTIDDFTLVKRVKLEPMHLHLLLKNRSIVHYLGLTGAKLKFDLALSLIQFRGTQKQVQDAEVLLSHTLARAHTQTLEWGHLDSQCRLDDIAAHTDVYFSRSDNGLNMTSFNPKQLKRAERLLLWQQMPQLCRSFIRQEVVEPSLSLATNLIKLPFQADALALWRQRFRRLWTWARPQKATTSPSFSRLMERLMGATSTELSLDDVTDAKHNLGAANLELEAVRVVEMLSPSPAVSVDSVWPQLKCPDLPEGLVTVTLGTVAFDEENQAFFDSNAALAADAALRLPLWHQPHLSSADINHLMNEEPGTHLIQLTFVPLPWLKEKDPSSYPPMVLSATLTDKMTVDVATIDLAAVHAEHSVLVPLPGERADIKVTYQNPQLVLMEDNNNTANEEPSELLLLIDEILHLTMALARHLASQPGIGQFLLKLKLNFSQPLDIHPTLDISVNGEVIPYHYVLTELRRLVEFSYHDRLVQHTLVEGGRLGGRRHEVTLAGDVGGDRALVQALLADAHQFIREM
ncbi:hypothetical protein JNB11_01245 [Kocuria palustris]|nr:hypothetical protein [Kocuria palustris]